jgi:dihydrofolate reductase
MQVAVSSSADVTGEESPIRSRRVRPARRSPRIHQLRVGVDVASAVQCSTKTKSKANPAAYAAGSPKSINLPSKASIMPILTAIVAMDERGLIGTSGQVAGAKPGLPWHLPKDLKRFRRLTLGRPIIMGRNTFEMIGKPLEGRRNVVLTSRPDYQIPGAVTSFSLKHAITQADETLTVDEIFIIGGAKIYEQALPLLHRLQLTLVKGDFTGDVFFPLKWMDNRDWKVVAAELVPADDKNPHEHINYTLEADTLWGEASHRITRGGEYREVDLLELLTRNPS